VIDDFKTLLCSDTPRHSKRLSYLCIVQVVADRMELLTDQDDSALVDSDNPSEVDHDESLKVLLKTQRTKASFTTSFEMAGISLQVIPFNCIGLDDIKRELGPGGHWHTISLDSRWKLEIGMERDKPDSVPGLSAYLAPIPTKHEIHDLSDIWSRKVKFRLSFRTKSDVSLGHCVVFLF
jgi:hypothetical protein